MSACGCDGRACRLEEGDPRHGSYNGYQNLGCRCRPCRDGVAMYRSKMIARRRAGGAVPAHLHGTLTGWRILGCRCAKCDAKWRDDYERQYGRRPVPHRYRVTIDSVAGAFARTPTEASRNFAIKQLLIEGLPVDEVASKFGLSDDAVRQVARSTRSTNVKPRAKVPPHYAQSAAVAERNAEMKRLVLDEGRTTTEVGRRFGVSRQRVQQIVNCDESTMVQPKAVPVAALRLRALRHPDEVEAILARLDSGGEVAS